MDAQQRIVELEAALAARDAQIAALLAQVETLTRQVAELTEKLAADDEAWVDEARVHVALADTATVSSLQRPYRA